LQQAIRVRWIVRNSSHNIPFWLQAGFRSEKRRVSKVFSGLSSLMATRFSWGGFVNEASHGGTGEAIQDAKKQSLKALKGVGAK
jgi:hypothetical protein